MNVLVINCGSSSLKFQFIETEDQRVLVRGLCERIGIDGSAFEYKKETGDKKASKIEMKDHNDAVAVVLSMLTDKEDGVIDDLAKIDAVGHRVVHGGEKFKEAVLINDEVIKEIEEVSDLAPLHNPAALLGIRACMDQMGNTPQVGVFDTAFHQTMEPESYLYAIPYDYYEKYKIRRYGFHGTSHEYVANRAAQILGKDISTLKIIVCHIGNGASMSAVKYGKCIDTSMGFTPLAGLVMGTRSGDIDPAIITYLMKKENMTADEVVSMLNKQSGVLGLSGVSSDYRDVIDAEKNGDQKAKKAMDVFILRIVKYIGAYMAELDGVDAVAFTAGAGENSVSIRERIGEKLGFLGVTLDKEKNKAARGVEGFIGGDDDRVKLMVIPTNEEYAIAEQTVSLLKR